MVPCNFKSQLLCRKCNPVPSCELWMMNWEAVAGVFPLSGLGSKFSVSDVFPTFYQDWGQSWSCILDTCKNTEEMGYIWGLGAGGFGKVARKQCTYVNTNVCNICFKYIYIHTYLYYISHIYILHVKNYLWYLISHCVISIFPYSDIVFKTFDVIL